MTAAMKLKELAPGKKSYDKLSVLKSRDITAYKGLYSQTMVFPVVMYGCESWTIKITERQKIDAFELVLEKTLESPLDCKEIKLVNPKGNQP